MDIQFYGKPGYGHSYGQAMIDKANKMAHRKMVFNNRLRRSGLKTRDCRNGLCIHTLCQVQLIKRRDGLA